MIKVWVGLLALTLVEVVLAYIQLGQGLMLTLLMSFSVIKAGMIMAWFMHLKYDRPALTWLLVPAFVGLVIVLIGLLLPDSYLLLENRP